MHKSLLPILMQFAIQSGHVPSIEETIGSYIHEWQDDQRGKISIKQMLQMTSGIARYGFTLNPFSIDFRCLYSGNTLPNILITPLEFESGTRATNKRGKIRNTR